MRLANKGLGSFRAEGNTIWLYDVIAADQDEAALLGGVAPGAFISTLSQMTGPVTLRINSPGGSVFGAQAMVAAMREYAGPITAQVDSLAASAASVIAVSCASCVMVPGSLMMIHKAWGFGVGNSSDMAQLAALLDKIDGQIAATYAEKSGGDVDAFLDMMAAETWLTAEEAVAAKLADSVAQMNNQRAQLNWDLSAFAAAPMPPAEPVPANHADDGRVARMRHADAMIRTSPI
jgi:ATP-dependent protease ClpP protease subunit